MSSTRPVQTRRRAVTGRDLQQSIITEARKQGWMVAHFPSIRDYRGIWRTPIAADGKGFPDLILVRDRLIAVEVKGDRDRLRPEQKQWQIAMRLAGVETYTWGADDWPDPIRDTLRRRASDG